MKIQVVSDIHLEFGATVVPNAKDTDVLILSGDICVAADYHSERYVNRYNAFFDQVCKEFKNVVYVFGNHEHYHGNFATTANILREKLSGYSNLHILDIGHVDIDDVRFVGGTLWTNFDNSNPQAMWDAQRMMNDYRGVLNGENADPYSGPKFVPADAIMYHEAMLKYIDEQCAQHNKIVVVGHHTPSYASIEGRYVGDALNAAYASHLSEYILDRTQIKLWTHGHVHVSQDYMIGTTRIVCNPRGYYGYEENEAFNDIKVVEI